MAKVFSTGSAFGSFLQSLLPTRIPWYEYLCNGLPHSWISCCSQIRHLQAKLSLRIRTRLTRYTHDLYLSSSPDLRYHRIAHEGGLEGVDQYITADVESWSEAMAGL